MHEKGSQTKNSLSRSLDHLDRPTHKLKRHRSQSSIRGRVNKIETVKRPNSCHSLVGPRIPPRTFIGNICLVILANNSPINEIQIAQNIIKLLKF